MRSLTGTLETPRLPPELAKGKLEGPVYRATEKRPENVSSKLSSSPSQDPWFKSSKEGSRGGQITSATTSPSSRVVKTDKTRLIDQRGPQAKLSRLPDKRSSEGSEVLRRRKTKIVQDVGNDNVKRVKKQVEHKLKKACSSLSISIGPPKTPSFTKPIA